jgi:predicted neuraminidase
MRVRILKKELIMPLTQSYFRACHSSTFVVAPNGDYLVTYFGGTREGTPDNAIYLSRCVGEKWLSPIKILHDGTPHWNAVLFRHDDRIYVFYKLGPTVHEWVSWYVYSDDSGYTWSEPQLLAPDDPYSRGPTRNKVIVASDGSWLAPGSIENEIHFDSFIDRSDDLGKTWVKCPIDIAHNDGSRVSRSHVWEGLLDRELWENDLKKIERWDGIIQPTLWRSEGSHVHAFMRSTRGHVYRSDSQDDGMTWSQAYETNIPNNCAGIDIARDDDGTLALVYNPVPWNWGRRNPISISLSTDNGETFTDPYPLETLDGELSYPSINMDGDILRITFTVRRQSFMYCECVIEK